MTDEERRLLTETARQVLQLFGNRDDMIVGITAALLDLYRMQFAAGLDTKDVALTRLRIQRDEINRLIHDGRAVKYLQSLIEALETDRLDAAKLLRESPAGSA
jgi:hypothetical protein